MTRPPPATGLNQDSGVKLKLDSILIRARAVSVLPVAKQKKTPGIDRASASLMLFRKLLANDPKTDR
jgi:hypothetical protein